MKTWKDRWVAAKTAAHEAAAPLLKALRPGQGPRRDPWYSAHAHQREVNERAARRPHPHQAVLDAIDEAHRGPRWISRRRGWLR